MGKINLSKTELLDKYNIHIDKILDECDWKTHFDGIEVCDIICKILLLNGEPEYSTMEVYVLYINKIDSLNLAECEWVENYGIKEIVEMVYDIIELIP